MGEYVRLASTGEQLKLGTCERFYWVRRDEVELMARQPEVLLPPGSHEHGPRSLKALLSTPHIVYRFSWPDEDLQLLSEAGERNPFRREELSVADVEMEHRDMTVCVQAKGGGHGVNVRVPCPYSLARRKPFTGFVETERPGPREAVLIGPALGQLAHIEGERFEAGWGMTLFSCIYCEAQFFCSEDEIERIREANPGPLALRLRGYSQTS